MLQLFHHPRYGKHLRQGGKFLFSGGLGACIDIGSLPVLVNLFHIPEFIAFYLSSLLAVTVVFFVNKHVTFKSKDATLPQMVRFALVYGTTIVLNGLLSGLLFRGLQLITMPLILHFAYLLAKMLAIGLLLPVNYVLSHTFIFRAKRTAAETEV